MSVGCKHAPGKGTEIDKMGAKEEGGGERNREKAGRSERSEDSNCQKACSLETQLVSTALVLNLSVMPRYSN